VYSVKSSSMYIYTVPNTSKYLENSIMTCHHLYSTCKKCSDHDPPPKTRNWGNQLKFVSRIPIRLPCYRSFRSRPRRSQLHRVQRMERTATRSFHRRNLREQSRHLESRGRFQGPPWLLALLHSTLESEASWGLGLKTRGFLEKESKKWFSFLVSYIFTTVHI